MRMGPLQLFLQRFIQTGLIQGFDGSEQEIRRFILACANTAQISTSQIGAFKVSITQFGFS
jgi:hypothetical protein